MTADSSNSGPRRLIKFPRVKIDRKCAISILKHSCWSAIILGAIMLALGIVLRSSVMSNPTSTVTSSGLLFMLIGIFIICMGPFAAIYDLVAKSKTRRRRDAESGSPSPSETSDPPSYSQVMTSTKTPSATYSMKFSVLSAKDLSDSIPPPPSYQEVTEIDKSLLKVENNGLTDARRMTAP